MENKEFKENELNLNNSKKSPKMVLKPSVLKVTDCSANISSMVQKEDKVFAFVSLSKEDISRPTTTLLKSDWMRSETCVPSNREELTTDVQTIDNKSQSFVFGQNLEERVVLLNKRQISDENNGINDHKKHKMDDNSKTTTHEDVEAVDASHDSNEEPIDGISSAISDVDSTDAKTENKPMFEVITGEEDEQNILSIGCRLYVWQSDTSSWKERGRGCLRLNDHLKDGKQCSRLVMRTLKTLRVILNVHIMPDMRFELSNELCLRFSNFDGIYLIKGLKTDISQLYSAIDRRLRLLSNQINTDLPQIEAIDDMSNDSCLSNN